MFSRSFRQKHKTILDSSGGKHFRALALQSENSPSGSSDNSHLCTITAILCARVMCLLSFPCLVCFVYFSIVSRFFCRLINQDQPS